MVVHYFINIHVFMIFFKMIVHSVHRHIFIYLLKRVIFVILRVAMSGKIIQALKRIKTLKKHFGLIDICLNFELKFS